MTDGISLRELVDTLVTFINQVIPVLGSLALVFFLISVLRYIYKAGDAGHKSAEKQAIGWGLVALFVIFSIWGILRIFVEAFPYDSSPGGTGGSEVLL